MATRSGRVRQRGAAWKRYLSATTKIERLQNSISERNEKIERLTAERDELQKELEVESGKAGEK